MYTADASAAFRSYFANALPDVLADALPETLSDGGICQAVFCQMFYQILYQVFRQANL